MKKQTKTPCKQQWINLEMQRQTNMRNLFVEFKFQLFDKLSRYQAFRYNSESSLLLS